MVLRSASDVDNGDHASVRRGHPRVARGVVRRDGDDGARDEMQEVVGVGDDRLAELDGLRAGCLVDRVLDGVGVGARGWQRRGHRARPVRAGGVLRRAYAHLRERVRRAVRHDGCRRGSRREDDRRLTRARRVGHHGPPGHLRHDRRREIDPRHGWVDRRHRDRLDRRVRVPVGERLPLDRQVSLSLDVQRDETATVHRQIECAIRPGQRVAELRVTRDGHAGALERAAVRGLNAAAEHGDTTLDDRARRHVALNRVLSLEQEGDRFKEWRG